MPARPTLAVFKFASCDGCQLSLLDCEDQLLAIAAGVEIAYFLEARTQEVAGPYDVGLVEGSITTAHDTERIGHIRQQCKYLVTIGACATAGGIQALRNWADVNEFAQAVYARPDYIRTLATSTPISEHVRVDFELRGCPINKDQLVELISALLWGRKPRVPRYSVCVDCKRRGVVCVAVAQGIACLGPVTQAGCGVICPGYDRECFGCFGPKEQSNLISLTTHYLRRGTDRGHLVRLTHNFNAYAPEFRDYGGPPRQENVEH
jgi:coenzyme F420-reducing hydrogenase gamma subunit